MAQSLFARIYYRACCFVLFLVAASVSFNGYYQKWHFAEADVPGDHSRAAFEAMVDGTAYRPYVYRQLVPAAANWIDGLVPEAAKSRLFALQGSGEDAFLYTISNSPTANDPKYFFRYLTMYILTFLFTQLAVCAMYLVCRAVEMPPVAAVFAPVIVILLLPYIMSNGGFFYDYVELAFLMLAVWMALKFEWWWLFPVAALGTWNKESFLLIVLTLYPLFRLRHSRLGALVGVSVLCCVCLAVYYALRVRFAHNPGGTVEVWWLDQLRYFMHPREWLFATEETYGLRLLKAYTLLPMTLLVWTVWRGWTFLPPAIRQHGKIAAIINIPLYFFFCSPGELRDLSMLYVVFLLVVAANLREWAKSVAPAGPLVS